MDFLGKTCPVCSQNFHEDDDVVVCPKCGAPYHRECYRENGKCIFPELHKSGKSWHEVYDDDPYDENEEEVKCPVCSAKNDKNAIVCRNCGSFISINVSDDTKKNADNSEDGNNNDESFDSFMAGNPFAIFMDPMGGVPKDENFDGVSGAELSKFVNTNTQYYLPAFARIKKEKRSKFNFAAFFFCGPWFLYRKQYVKGTIISLIYLLSEIASIFLVRAYSLPIFREANTIMENALGESPIKMAQTYLSWTFDNYSYAGVFWIALPYLLILLRVILCVVSGIIANRSYYKFSIRKIKRIKEKTYDEDIMKAISESGGVNNAIAWTLFVCYVILSIAEMFI